MSTLAWRTERRRIGELVEWEKNPRRLSAHDAEHLTKSLERFGYVEEVVINADGSIIGGHQRRRVMLAQAMANPDALIDVRVPSRPLTEREAEELAIRLNKNTGEWDFDRLAEEFDLNDLLDWGFTEEELSVDGSADGDDHEIDLDQGKALRQKWGVAPGQVWVIPSESVPGKAHRLICADSRSAESLRVLAGEPVELLITSPPYNVGVNYDSHDDATAGWSKYSALLCDVVNTWTSRLSDGRAVCWNIGVSPKTSHFRQAVLLEDSGLTFCRQFVWRKVGVPVPTAYAMRKAPKTRHVTSNYTHEVVLVYSKGTLSPGGPTEIDPLLEDDVFELHQSSATADVPSGAQRTGAHQGLTRRAFKAHPAVFPSALPQAFASAYCDAGAVVADPFVGSGSTILAAERSGRVGVGCDLDPGYIAVSLERLAAEGLVPEKV